jgi:hypothetical protein
MVDAYSVTRGLDCGCICPSCSSPLIARRGAVREPHFAHAISASGLQRVCELSALVSIRLMAHEILLSVKELAVPARPFHTRNSAQRLKFESIEINARFEEVMVDALLTIQRVPLAIYLTHTDRVIPRSLQSPNNRKAGILKIDLEKLWGIAESSGSGQVGKSELERALVEDIRPKSWVFHPAREIEAKKLRPHSTPTSNSEDSKRFSVEGKLPAQKKTPTTFREPLLQKHRCTLCDETWFASPTETDARKCPVCKKESAVAID